MMKRKRIVWCTPFIGAFLVLTACTGQQSMQENQVGAANLDFHDKTVNQKGNSHVHGQNASVNVIPSIDRTKKKTTNEKDTTTSGLGTNVYSLIGSSGLHDGGISSHLESRLSSQGIPGIKVFVLDDTIILARAQPQTTSTSYDEMQSKVLSNTSGASGKGDYKGVNPNKLNNTEDNLDKAKALMSKAFNGQVQILTITNPQALPLIDGIKANIKSATPSYSKLTSDINILVQMTREK